MKFEKDFLLRFKSPDDLLRFMESFPDYFSMSPIEFKFDDLYFSVLPASSLDDVRHFLYKNFNIHDYDICYPYALLLEPLLV